MRYTDRRGVGIWTIASGTSLTLSRQVGLVQLTSIQNQSGFYPTAVEGALDYLMEAIQQINDQDVVFVRTAPDRFVIRSVHAGETADGKTPILEGLAAGEQVVVHGSFVLKSQLLKSTLESE